MPTNLGPKYSIEWEGMPPHMLPRDYPVWLRFLKQYRDEFLWFFYDVFVGGPVLTPEQEKDPMWRMWRANTAKRIDALGEKPDQVWIIEVTTNPGMRALGQLLTYQHLWLEDPKIEKIERLVLVTENIDTDIMAAAGRLGIMVFVV